MAYLLRFRAKDEIIGEMKTLLRKLVNPTVGDNSLSTVITASEVLATRSAAPSSTRAC